VKPELAAFRSSVVPDGNDAPGFADGVTGSLLGPIEATLVGAHGADHADL
jgi:hypothetical protein